MLTAKQGKFATAIADGADQTLAYKTAYDAENMSPQAIWVESSRLKRHPKVALKIEALNAEAEVVRQGLLLSREEAILARLEHEALTAKTDSARIRALELLGRHAGLFVERVEIEQVERSAEAIERDIRQRLHRLGLVKEE
jgi:phage terminase small subunit